MSAENKPRTYRKQRRAESEARTRKRIAAAAMELHGSVGPARTTISDVAARAGVQRATVYRHYPSEESLFAACSAHWYSLYPPPDATRWSEIPDPESRLRAALADLYEWYASDAGMFTNIFRDASVVPAMAEMVEARRASFEHLVGVLMKGRRERGRSRMRSAAIIQHAISFPAWASLVRDGALTHEEAIETMLAALRG